MIERPPSPHDLIGENWVEIDETALATLGASLIESGAASLTAEQKAYTDGNTYHSLLPEGFEAQVEAVFRVGGMASDLSGALGKGGAETEVTAQAVMTTKLFTAVTVGVAEALIAAKEAEIAALQAASLRPEVRAMRIQQLRNEINAIINEARRDIQELYNGTYTPTTPPPPSLSPLIHKGPPAESPGGGAKASPADHSNGADALDNPIEKPQYDSAPAGEHKPVTEPAGGSSQEDAGATKPQSQTSGDLNQGESASVRETSQQSGQLGDPGSALPSESPMAMPPMSAPSSGASSGGGGLSSVSSAMPKMSGGGLSAPSASAPSMPSAGGLSSGGGSGLSGLSGGTGGGAGAAPPATPASQFLSGAAQGLANPSTLASGASAAAQPFKPPPGSTMPAGPPPASSSSGPVSSSPPVQQVQAPAGGPSSSTSMGAPPAAGVPPASAVPLAPPPAAGVPNAAAPPAPAAPPAAPVAPAGGGGGGPTVAPPPPGVMNLGAKSAAVKAAQMGSHAVGEGLRSTPEFNAAVALVAALHDPAIGAVCEWACAVFKQPGEQGARFVVASREGLSWIPSGVYMPDGVTVAALDDSIPYETRKLWRGLKPPARVLAQYAKAIGEQPRIVVAREWLGLHGLFSKRTVLVADDQTVVEPNPVLNPAGRHRLQMASPNGWWAQVQTIPDADIPARIRDLAAHVAQVHDEAFGVHDVGDEQKFGGRALRAIAVEQIGRPGGEAVWQAVEQQMHYVRSEIMTAPIAAPEPLYEGWNSDLTAAEQMLRGWEVLWLAQRPPTREALADMTYAAAAALM